MKNKIQSLYVKARKIWMSEGIQGVLRAVARYAVRKQIRLQAESKSAVVMEVLDIMVTEKCTLRCRYCCNLMQYYTAPQHYDIAKLCREVEALLNKTDKICTVNVIGGEPFLYKHLPQLFDAIYKFRRKYQRLSVVTNGTVVPSDDIVLAMKKYNVACMISDYGVHSKNIHKVIKKMKAFKVPVRDNQDTWLYMAQLLSKAGNEEQTRRKYEACCAPCRTIRDGRFYRCEFLANGDNLNAFPHDGRNYVNITPSADKSVLAEYLHRDRYYPGCAFCSGYSAKEHIVATAEQVSRPVDYKRYAVSTSADEHPAKV